MSHLLHRRFSLAVCYALLVVCALSTPRGVWAQAETGASASEVSADSEAYKQAVDAALTEYDLGHFEEARSLFERAHALYPNARTLRGLGMIEFELRHYVRAEELLEQALASEQKPLTAEQRADVNALLLRTRQFTARYTLEVDPPKPDLSLLLDGQAVTTDEQGRLRLEAGEHRLVVSAPDALPREIVLDVRGGEQQTLRIELELKHSSPPAVTAPPRIGVVDRGDDGMPPGLGLGIALTSVGGVALIGGAVLGALALGDARNAQARNDGDAKEARSLALASDVAMGAGVLTAVVGVVLLVRRKHARQAAHTNRPELVGTNLQVRF